MGEQKHNPRELNALELEAAPVVQVCLGCQGAVTMLTSCNMTPNVGAVR